MIARQTRLTCCCILLILVACGVLVRDSNLFIEIMFKNRLM